MTAGARTDEGFTVAELAVALSIVMVAITLALSMLYSLQDVVGRQVDRSETNDQARTAIERLDRDIRSGNVLTDPAIESPAYYSLRVYTQSNANELGNPPRCVQWRVTSSKLERRSWPPTFGAAPDPATVSAWRIEATSIVNADLAVRPFESEISTPEGVRTVSVKVLANSNLAKSPQSTVRIEISATGRNTSFRFPSNACTPAPA